MKFNDTKESVSERTKTTNYEGGESYNPDTPELGLAKNVINNLLEDEFYESDNESLKQVVQAFYAAADENPEFPLKLAAYARQEMYLRDVSQVLLILAASDDRTKEYVEEWAPSIIDRADEPCTVVAAWDELIGGTMPKPLKKGINKALHKFDKYQFDKYDNDNREVNIRDVINRTHPKPVDDERDEAFERLMKGDLDKYPDVQPLDESQGKTWETVISEKGNNAEAWREVIDDMGLFALIRNIRNMKEAGLESEEIVGHMETGWIENAQIYPFRFYQSYKAVKDAGVSDPVVEDKLSQAIDTAADSLDEQLTDTFTAVDLSGSMFGGGLSQESGLERAEIGSLFGAMMMRHGSDAGGFGSDFQLITAHHDTPTLELQDKILNTSVGHSTNAHLAIRHLVKRDKSYDRVVVFTDEQLWDSYRGGDSLKNEWERYKEQVNQAASLYIVDLASYGDLSFPEGYPDVYNLQGWTSDMLDYIQHAENEEALLNDIKNQESYTPEAFR
jgi:hypothetical protein